MTEEDAISIVQEQFQGPQGFVARLRRGDGLDAIGVERARSALAALQTVWGNRPDVPKRGVLPLVDLTTLILECATHYPKQRSNIEDLAYDLQMRVDQMLLEQPRYMTEERAIALVYVHLTGQGSIADLLRHRSRVDPEMYEELESALGTLAVSWAERDAVPKVVVRPMLNVRDLIRSHAGWYPNQQTELESIADHLAERVRECLS